MSLVQRWVPDQLGPGHQRLPITLADDAGLLMKGPAELTGRVIDILDDSIIADNLVATRRSLGEGTAPFWVFETDIEVPNIYVLLIDGGPSDGATLQVRAASVLVVPRPVRHFRDSTHPPSTITAAWNPCAVAHPSRVRSTMSL